MCEDERKLTMDQPVTYQIKVPGQIDERWADIYEGMTIQVTDGEKGSPISSLTCTLDQAALLGLLRRLYASAIPLISINLLISEPD